MNWIDRILNQPKKVLVFGLSVVLVSLILDGTAVKLWKLKTKETQLKERISELESESDSMVQKMTLVHDPKYLEREARDRFDLVREDDLVFVFTE